MNKPAPLIKHATMQDVAIDAGVSMKSVSRVVNKEAGVSKKLKEKVEASVAKLNFRPNAHARYMAKSRSNLIGFPLLGRASTFFYSILDTAIENCKNTPYDILIHPINIDEVNSTQSIIEALDHMKIASNIEAVLLPPPFSSLDKVNEWLINRGIPFAGIGQISDCKSPIYTTTNIAEGMMSITGHLIELGHQRIGYISGPEHLLAVAEREKGFYSALKQNHIEPDHALFKKGNFCLDKALVAAKELLTLPVPPTAIVCSNDITAFAVMQVATRMGLRIPADLSVTGFDDIPEASMSMVPLTTIRQPIQEMTVKSLGTLLTYLQTGKLKSYDPVCKNHIILRETTAPPRC